MASAVRSTEKTKKVIRRISKSPKRIYSPSRVQKEEQIVSGESAYSDPMDSSRSLCKFL